MDRCMKFRMYCRLGAVLACATSQPSFAQDSQTAGKAVSPLSSSVNVLATSPETFAGFVTLRRLMNGQVLVNDTRGRRILLLDANLKVIRTVADSTRGAPIAYGRRPGMMVSYAADSTAFVDGSDISVLVLDEKGRSVRTMALRQTRDASFISDARFGKLTFDKSGNMIYKAGPAFFSPSKELFAGMSGVMLPKDSAPLVRVNSASRAIDTITFIHTPVPSMRGGVSSDGVPIFISVLNPLDTFDDWAVLSDGTIGVFRGRDFTLELFDSTATRNAVKVPFKWRRLSDFEKAALIDSAKARRGFPAGAVSVPGSGTSRIQFVDPSELADYFPAFGPNSVLRDNKDNFWVKTLPTTQTATFTYEIIDRTGKMLRKILVDKNSEILSIDRDGSVFLLTRIEETGGHLSSAVAPAFKLQRASVR